jgi:DNA invertase Pin-like site-specific DNA recombinase
MTKVGIYCRISDDREGTRLAVDRQEKLCRELAAKRGWTVHCVYSDDDISASAATRRKRPGYQRLLDDARAGMFDMIVSYTLKRLTRRYREGADLLDLADQTGMRFSFVRAPETDLNTAAGRKHFRGMVNDAISESEEIGERVRDKFAEKRANGEHNGGPRRYGYDPDGITVRPAEAAKVAEATGRIIAGDSLYRIAKDWRDADVPTVSAVAWTPNNLRSILLRARNAGLMEHAGEVVGKAEWPPLVSDADWYACRAILTDPSRRTNGNASQTWQGSGVYLCGVCASNGTYMTMRSGKRKNTKNGITPIYRCRVYSHNNIKAIDVDEFVDRTITKVLRTRGKDLLRTEPADQTASLDTKIADVQRELDALAEQRGRLEITAREHKIIGDGMKATLADLEAQRDRRRVDATLASVLGDPDPGAAYLATQPERRRAILRAMAVITIGGAVRGPSRVDLGRIGIEPIETVDATV